MLKVGETVQNAGFARLLVADIGLQTERQLLVEISARLGAATCARFQQGKRGAAVQKAMWLVNLLGNGHGHLNMLGSDHVVGDVQSIQKGHENLRKRRGRENRGPQPIVYPFQYTLANPDLPRANPPT